MSRPNLSNPPNFPGYTRLQGPEVLSFSSGVKVRTPSDYLVWQGVMVTSKGGNLWQSTEPVEAYVNHGRWIAKCRWCDTGILTRPDWGVAYCAECGARYEKGFVKFPPNAEKIADLLCKRVRRENQNWDSRQSVEDLEKENKEILGC